MTISTSHQTCLIFIVQHSKQYVKTGWHVEHRLHQTVQHTLNALFSLEKRLLFHIYYTGSSFLPAPVIKRHKGLSPELNNLLGTALSIRSQG